MNRHEAAMDDLDKFPSQLAERFQVRLPDGMRDRLKTAAEANKRSMNAEIVARLDLSLNPPTGAEAFANAAVHLIKLAKELDIKLKIVMNETEENSD